MEGELKHPQEMSYLEDMRGKWQCCEWLKGTVIGSGSFGTVNLAIDTTTGSLFVVKSATTEAGVASLRNEADILRGLDSPYIVKCIGKDGGATHCSLFFEYMGGGSISDMMQKFGGALQEKVIRLYTRQILLGLHYLHRNNIVHSDIKCNNVLVAASGTVKLTDFGCAKKRRRRSPTRGIGGSPLWMAPEVLRSQDLDFAADIWSLGCTVIEMATGRPPWGATNPMAAMLRISQGEELPRFPTHFSAEGVDFLFRCLDRDPRRRWSSEMLLDHPFVRMGDAALSPTSVLDVGGYDYSECPSSDEEEDDEFARRVPFSMKKFHASEDHSEASDGWITVRKR